MAGCYLRVGGPTPAATVTTPFLTDKPRLDGTEGQTREIALLTKREGNRDQNSSVIVHQHNRQNHS